MGRRCFVVAAVMLVAGTGEARAQRISVIRCMPSVMTSVGVNTNGDRNGEQTSRGADAAAAFEMPASRRWSARVDAGTVGWTFQQRDYRTEAVLLQERVRVRRITVSAIQRGPDCGSPFRPYAGVGAGVYRYHFRDQHVTVTMGGIHGVFGLDVMARERLAFTGEVGIHAANGPRRGPVVSVLLWSVRATVGARIVF